MELLVQGIENAGSTDPLAVAKAMENGRYKGVTGEVWMRSDNHQLVQPLYVSTFKQAGSDGVKYDVERTGIGPRTDYIVAAENTTLTTTCEMVRP